MRVNQGSFPVSDFPVVPPFHDGKPFRRKRAVVIFAAYLAIFVHGRAIADDTPPPSPYTSRGYVGLIEMPSARTAPDGEISIASSFFQNDERYDLGFQALPWLETAFQYSGQVNYDPQSYGPIEWDRSFNFKARLWNETDLLPTVALGMNDFIGTGLFSSEYLVASKQFGDFDATIGMGWGVLASADPIQNPLAKIFGFGNTRANTTTNQGQFELSTYFHGPAGLFGGIDWRTPIDHLTLLAEYSSDNYAAEAAAGSFRPRNQFNFGASYQISESVTLGLQWLYGRTVGVSAALMTDPTTDPFPTRIGPALPPVHIRTAQEQQQALNNLLDQRNATTQLPSISASDRNALVDALWNRGLSNASVSGRSLLISFSGGNAQRICQDTAQLVGHYALFIDQVEVRGNSPPQRCAVPVLVHAAINSSDSAVNLTGLFLSSPALLTIDASATSTSSRQDAIAAIRADAAKQQVAIQALSLTDSEATVYYSNLKYFHEKDAIDRLVRVLMADAPPDIEKFRLIATLGGQPQNEFDILREPIERSIAQTDTYKILQEGNVITPPPLQNPILAQAERGTYPRFSWALYPQFRQQLFDPTNPLGMQFLAAGAAEMEILPGLSLNAEVEGNIWDNFNTDRPSDSVLPHVRTDYLKFFTEGKNGIGDLEADYEFRILPNVFAIARLGYLESMFAGAGGEVLWRPEGERWALGTDLYNVWERDFNRQFGLQAYHVVTGHISLYYDSPWYDLNFALRAGRYLAGDTGVTLEVSRRFYTGMEIGIFMTKTNVSSAQFGEGSFDKGIMLRIPLSFGLPINTQSLWALDLRPTQRDGGQRLENDALLYNETRRSSFGEILQTDSQ